MKLEITTPQKAKVQQFTKLVQDLCTMAFGDNWTMQINPSNKPKQEPDLYKIVLRYRASYNNLSDETILTLNNILADYDQAVIDMEAHHG